MKHTQFSKRQGGFTIIELMIATAIFSVILLLISAAIIQVGRAYYKGLNETATAARASAVVDELTQLVRYSGSQIYTYENVTVGSDEVQAICAGKTMYVYIRGDAVGVAGRQGLVSYPVSACNEGNVKTPATAISVARAREHLGEGMRIARLEVLNSGDVFNISLRLLNGPADLICSPTVSNCTTELTADQFRTQTDLSCRSDTGNQFCSVSEINTTVTRRVSGGN